jgi:hypothetical protein
VQVLAAFSMFDASCEVWWWMRRFSGDLDGLEKVLELGVALCNFQVFQCVLCKMMGMFCVTG